MEQGYNTVLQMTGRRLDEDWAEQFFCNIKERSYQVVIAYPIVAVPQLLERAKDRQSQTGQEAAPDEKIREGAVAAAQNLPRMQRYVTSILLYDNNGERGREKLIFAYNIDGTNLADCSFLKTWLSQELHEGNIDLDATDIKVLTLLRAWVKPLL